MIFVMDTSQAQKIIEALRNGIPPEGAIKHITVGRKAEIEALDQQLDQRDFSALLLQANYGTGKTHLLKYIREIALEAGYVVSMVTLDAKSGIAFNKLDQVLGEINRRLEVPTNPGIRSIRYLFNEARDKYNVAPDDKNNFWYKVSNQFKWDYDHSGQLKSPAMYAALRAWFYCDLQSQHFIEDWLFRPANYTAQKSALYRVMIGQLRNHFRDPRSERQISTSGAFDLFKGADYQRCWDAMIDLNTLAIACGFRGLVLLVDEFEDVISNINRKTDQHDAFWRLFEFFGGAKFTGLSFFAVTPDFVQKCKTLLIQQNVFDFDYSQFDKLPMFKLSPLETNDIVRLGSVIAQYHQRAYGWTIDATEMDSILQNTTNHAGPDKVRLTIKEIVNILDRKMDEQDGD